MTDLILGGAEIPSNRTLLERTGVQKVMLNYWSLKKRGLPKTKSYYISEHFLPEMKVWVDSGATQADKANLSPRELEEYAADYEEFIAVNYDRIEGWVEFDSQVFGLPRIQQNRAAFENDPKMWVVWHDSYGTMVLQRWATEYQNIAIPSDAIESNMSLAGITRGLSTKYGTSFHALATAKPDNLRQIPFATASTLSWLSPMRRGETIVWDGSKLVRYPKKMKDQARIRYKSVVEKAGLDFDKFVSDDTLEATKVAIWSYLQLEATMDKDKPKLEAIKGGKKAPDTEIVYDNSDDTLYTGLMDYLGGASDNSGSEMRKLEATEIIKRDPQEQVNLPVFGYQMKNIIDIDDEGNEVIRQAAVAQSTGASLRQCNTCFVASNCPAFKPDNECAFNLPVEVKTPEQLRGLLTSVVEMQAARVAFMRYAEELNSGYVDPNTSQEIDRLFKLVANIKDLDSTKDTLKIEMERKSAGGVLSAIFGDRVQALQDTQQMQEMQRSEAETTDIIRASIED